MSRYLEKCLPLLSTEAEKQAARQGVEAFLNGDGPAVHARLLEYDKTQVSAQQQ
jgi:hypothetical protein